MAQPQGHKHQCRSLAAEHLKPGITFGDLDAIAYAISDNEGPCRLNEAQATLFRSINQAQQLAA